MVASVHPSADDTGDAGAREGRRLIAGAIVDGRFRIESFLGSGGMCDVYRTTHLSLNRPVALKVLRSNLMVDRRKLERFRREAMAIGQLEHPNIVRVLGLGHTDSRPYIALEFLDGCSLSELLQHQPEHRLTPDRALPIFLQICDALEHAHHHGIVHRDLKPSNVMLIDDGKCVKLVDFGIARMLPGSGKNLQRLTGTNDIIGSALYMSPEQCLAQPLDERSDIYSLACLMYETLTGEPPFSGNNVWTTMAQHMNVQPAPNRRLGQKLAPAILAALNKDPRQRPATIAELKEALLHPGTAMNRTTCGAKMPGLLLMTVLIASLTLIAVISSWGTFNRKGAASARPDYLASEASTEMAANDALLATKDPPYRELPHRCKEAAENARRSGDLVLYRLAIAKLADVDRMNYANNQSIQLCLYVLRTAPADAKNRSARQLAASVLSLVVNTPAELEEALPWMPELRDSMHHSDRHHACLVIARCAINQGRYADAIANLREALRAEGDTDPDRKQVRRYLNECYAALREHPPELQN